MYVCVFRVASCQAWVSGHGKVEADGVVCARVRRCFPSVRRRTNGIPARGVLYVPGYLRWSSAPFNVVWCERQGDLVLAPKCNNEKHNLAKDAATLLEKTIHPGVLCKLLMGASGICKGSSQYVLVSRRATSAGRSISWTACHRYWHQYVHSTPPCYVRMHYIL